MTHNFREDNDGSKVGASAQNKSLTNTGYQENIWNILWKTELLEEIWIEGV